MEEYCKEHLIKCQTSDTYTPQQNGLAERHNRTIIESLRTILTDSKINRQYWSNIVKFSMLTLNQIPSHRSNKSLYELFKGKTLPLEFSHPISNPVSFLNEPKTHGWKLYPKGSKGRLIGYNEELQSYHILPENRRIIDTKSVQFLDFQPIKSPQIDEEDNEPFEIIQEEHHLISNQQIIDKELSIFQKEDRIEIKQEFDLDDEKNGAETEEFSDDVSDDRDDNVSELLCPTSSSTWVLRERTAKIKPPKYSHLTSDPSTFKKAVSLNDKEKLIEAADNELNSIESHKVWEDIWALLCVLSRQ
ncbi:hypothetical protein VP01_276g1 [Puccinia sorghi]|uniref:Integrase catalytic domain-containing protein n=1 Tax=Puccinia sorghi TaxID=27349 RepID=A0A0L6V2U7_9BASI|nr:hypothetical protein VP01_276g1 [Puccinia sorghi]